ncbi:Rrf2 family transcriptional regulator [Candidatus Saganbacteria bacterium]|nr:Rrf2 family transcriptional regulator [Candidatus Saganbacteria bacterium]
MKLITRETDYAMRALVYMARPKNSLVSVAELIKELKFPRPFLRKILQTLKRRRVLKSHKGKRGGFLLARPPEKIFLVDLIGIFQGPIELDECLFKKKLCPDVNVCLLRKKLQKIEAEVVAQLRSISIGSLRDERN